MRVVGEPISSNELAKVLGKSPQAVRQALSSSGAIKIDDSRPILWALPGSIRMEQRVPAKFSDVDYVVSTKQTDDIVAIWNAQREAVGTSLTQLEIVSTMKPGKVAEQVGSLAGSLAALAYALDQVKSMPDWYEILTDKE
jgi:hypothetical protein